MPTLAAFLLSIAGPFVLRAIAAIGMGLVTYTGVDTALSGLIGMAQSNWGGLGADVLGLCGVAGVPEALGLITGAMTSRVGAWVALSATRWVTKA